MAGKIQNEDVKSSAELASAGGTDSQLINDTKIYVTAKGLNKQLYAAIVNGDIGGGGGGSTDLLGGLTARELGAAFATAPGQMWDDFNATGRGTLSNTIVSGSKLQLSGSNLSGTYSRSGAVSAKVSSAEGIIVASLIQIAPKPTAVSSNTFKIQGDVTNLFTSTGSKKVKVSKLVYPDGALTQPKLVSIFNATTNILELFPVSSCTYSSGADETTLVLTNTNSLDLSMGLSASEYPAQLRIEPFDYQFELGGVAATFESVSIADVGIYEPSTIRLPGENFLSKISGSIAGTILKTDAAISLNRQYVLVRVLEKQASNNSLWHWFGSSDYGKTFSELGSKTSAGVQGYAQYENAQGNFNYQNSNQLAVANNGRIVSTYGKSGGTYSEVWAIQCDLSVGASSFTDFQYNAGGGMGQIHASGSVDIVSIVGIDPVDASFVAITNDYSGNSLQPKFFSWVGSTTTYLGAGVNVVALWTLPPSMFITGTGSAHRVHLFVSDNSTWVRYTYWDQGNLTGTTVNVSSLNTAQYIMDARVTSSGKAYVVFGDITNGTTRIGYSANVLTGTPSFTSYAISNLVPSLYNGWSASGYVSWYKTPHRLVVNPSNDNHVLIAADMVHPDSVDRAHLYEICDVTNFQGITVSNYAGPNTGAQLKVDTTQAYAGQTFLATSNRLRTASFRAWQVGTIPSGYALSCELQQTSAGFPNGTVVATATNTIDPSTITKAGGSTSGGQWIYFNFANVTITSGVTYGLVIKATYPTSATNYIYLHASNTSAYASGSAVIYNSGTLAWANLGGTHDLLFEINGEYVTHVGQALHSTVSWTGQNIHDQETQIELIDSTTAAIVSRRTPLMSADADRPYVGHPFRRVLSFGNGGTQSALTSPVIAGYAPSQYDPNLVFTTAPGSVECARINVTTGVVDAANRAEDRSGFSNVTPNYAGTPTVNVPDANFQNGSMSFNGSNQYVLYNNCSIYNLVVGKPFVMEAMIHLSGLTSPGAQPTAQVILSTYNTIGTAWHWGFLSSGYLSFVISSGNAPTATIQANDKTEPLTPHKVRVVYDGTTCRLYRAETSPFTTFTEVTSYSSQQTVTATASSAGLCLGAVSNPAYQFYGKISDVKFAQGTTSFAFSGYKSQPPITGIMNLGTEILGEYRVGQSGPTAGQNFIQPAYIPRFNNQAVVDSYDQILKLKLNLTTPGTEPQFRATLGRVSTRDNSSIQGYMHQFSKA